MDEVYRTLLGRQVGSMYGGLASCATAAQVATAIVKTKASYLVSIFIIRSPSYAFVQMIFSLLNLIQAAAIVIPGASSLWV